MPLIFRAHTSEKKEKNSLAASSCAVAGELPLRPRASSVAAPVSSTTGAGKLSHDLARAPGVPPRCVGDLGKFGRARGGRCVRFWSRQAIPRDGPLLPLYAPARLASHSCAHAGMPRHIVRQLARSLARPPTPTVAAHDGGLGGQGRQGTIRGG
jgi:hypothetical protein